MWRELLTRTGEHDGLLMLAAIASILTFAISAALLPWMIARLPHDYFVRSGVRAGGRRCPVWMQASRLVARNALGAVLLAAGIAMLVLPGQGVLTILVALLLLSFPSKRSLELWLARRRSILRALNWVRTRAGEEPFVAPPPRSAA